MTYFALSTLSQIQTGETVALKAYCKYRNNFKTVNKQSSPNILTVPSIEAGCCRGSERNGVSMGAGGEGGPERPERGKDKQLMPSKGGDNMEKDEEEQPNRT